MNLLKAGFILITIGFLMVFVGTALSLRGINAAGLILIGPVPIVFGTSPEITIIAMLIGLLLMLFMFLMGRKNV